MNIYLAATMSHQKLLKEYAGIENFRDILLLESFFYMRGKIQDASWFENSENFLLDSGAFTFMSNGKIKADFDKYTEEYAEFINRYNIKYFFEMDVDYVVGLKTVERLRDKLERLTGKKPIPVWHLSRGKEYFEWMCQNYPYVAFGGIITDGLPSRTLERYFPWFTATAHKYGAKIHGLGYTSKKLHSLHFDSVDSSSWLFANKVGGYHVFNPITKDITFKARPKGTKIADTKELLARNFVEWVKFQKFAKTNF